MEKSGEKDETVGPIKLATEAIKAVVELLHLNPEAEKEKTPSRPGPLVVVGRFYLSLTFLLAAMTSGAALIDWKTYPHEPSFSVSVLRLCMIFAVGLGLLFGVALIAVLLWKHTLFLFNPTELSADA